MRIGVLLALAAWSLLVSSGRTAMTAQEHPLPTYTCYKTADKITIDGKVEEPAWKQAVSFKDFVLADGVTKPTYATEFRALWDDKTLYLCYVCEDPVIIATMTKRDSGLYAEDCVEAFLSTGGELRRYYEFEFSPRNVQMDASVYPDPDGVNKIVDYSWNCAGIRTATHIAGAGKAQRWSIEIALPFSSIGRELKAPAIGEQWRANFYRLEYSTPKAEAICWSPMWGPGNFHLRERFGHLVFAGPRGKE